MPDRGLSGEKVVLLGSGNVATHLGLALVSKNIPVLEVFSKSEENAKNLALALGAGFTSDITQLNQNGTLYIVCLKDDAIVSVISSFKFTPPLLVHTSGSIPLDALKNYGQNHGVIYPLQTFSKEKSIHFESVPLCIEGDSDKTQNQLMNFAGNLSPLVYRVNSTQRSYLHLSAVFSCNFVNYLYTIGAEILKENGLPFEMLQPLIKETANKALKSNDPFTLQTGPAIREDKIIIEKHLSMVNDSDLKKLYKDFTELIIKEKNNR